MRVAPILHCFVLFVLGCVPSLGGQEQVQVLSYGPDGYVTGPVDLSLISLRPLETEGVRVFFGGSITFMSGPRIDEPPAPLVARVERGVDGSLVPTDYLTLLAFCLLHHLDESRTYIAGLGVAGVREEQPYEIYLHPEVNSAQLGNFRDNMAYVRGENWFLVAPEDDIDAIPLACNRAVVAHEFAHAVSFHSDPTARFPSGDVIAIDEGFADIVGAGVTNSAVGASASFDDASRDLNVARVDEVTMAPHERGAVLASLFWAYRGALIAESGEIDESTDRMVRLALETMVSFQGETAPLLVDFVARAVALAPEPAPFCQRAPLAFPVEEVIGACE